MASTVQSPSKEVRDAIGTKSGQYSNFTRELYYLGIYKADKKGLWPVSDNKTKLSIGPASAVGDSTSPEYYFKLPPQTHEITDPFSTVITPTQNQGKCIERNGSPIKELRLTGTTGLRPSRDFSKKKTLKLFGFDTGASGIGAQLGEAILGDMPDVGGAIKGIIDLFTNPSPWPKGEAIGYDDICFLKNMFRLYSDLQYKDSGNAVYIMVWLNIRDGEYWVVEPVEFKLIQSKDNPLGYDYSITLKTIAPLDYQFKLDKDPRSFIKTLRQFIARVSQLINTVKQSFVYISLQIDRFARLPLSLVNSILEPMNAVLDGFEAIKTSVSRFKASFKASCRAMVQSFKTFLRRVAHLFNRQDLAINAMRKAKRAVEKVLREPDLQPDSVKSRVQNAIEASDQSSSITGPSPGTTQAFSNSALSVLKQGTATQIKAATVYPKDNIHTLAQRLLGDASKYPQLIAANSLVAPYVSAKGGIGLIKPGDKILYPAPGNAKALGNSVSTAGVSATGDEETNLYGTDVLLNTDSNGKVDFALSATGDLALCTGSKNLIQAVGLKFQVANGDLPRHPAYGASYKIGTKATPQSLTGIRIDTERTLLSDPRIDSIEELNFYARGDILVAQAKLNVIAENSLLNVSLPLRT